MQIPLSRIEYDYIVEAFLQDLPPLLLQSGALFYMLPSGSYTIKNSKLYFQPLSEFIGKKTSVFFEHKKRSIVFHTAVYADAGSCYVMFPDIAYKYDPEKQPQNNVFAEIYIPDNPPITAQEHEHFPLDSIIHTDLHLPPFTDFLPSAYQTAAQFTAEKTVTQNIFPLFLYRLHEFEQQTFMMFNPYASSGLYVLFIDSKILICGCRDDYAVSIGKRQSLRFVLHFPHRTIHSKGRSLFSHFLPKSNCAVLGFVFEELFEEDKRFLYERVYHEKYNPLSF
ncbi:hypothetical protein [Treponema sp. OMZ 857]|uniref:hypothetical protein n=1 Tax=Treponema sp. OMZ 857 TaxID=1643513 RepID=UPI0020A49882|nr:hypothetical protein [Treponema sp. OMZ 857]UTC43846.1 hypothetical protein E4N66_07010 [Treponema sp. OMZ 857]